MSRIIRVALAEGGSAALRFPEVCVCCAGLATAESRLVFDRLIMRDEEQVRIERSIPVPHCARCARATQASFLASLLPLLAGFLVFGGGAFLLTAWQVSVLGWDELGQPRTTPNSLVLGGAAALVAGFVGGALTGIVARFLLVPFYGLALFCAPLLVTQFVTGTDFVAGLKAKARRDLSILTLRFANEEVARGFAERNAALEEGSPRGGR